MNFRFLSKPTSLIAILPLIAVLFNGAPLQAQECSAELIRKWGGHDEGYRKFMKPGEWELVVRARECSKSNLAAYKAQVEAATPDEAGLKMLEGLRGRYGNIDMVWLDKNELMQVIGAKQTELGKEVQAARLKAQDDKCLPVLADIRIPSDFADAELATRDRTITLNRFLCAAAVHSGDVKITAASADTYKVAFSGAYLKFRINRPSRYLKDAVKTASVEAIGNERGEEPADDAVMQYVYGQFIPSYAKFLSQ